MAFVWSSSLIDASYDGAWNKLTYLQRLLRSLLYAKSPTQYDWVLWVDWDVVITDLAHELPLEDYAARGARLVVGGDPLGIGGGGGGGMSGGEGGANGNGDQSDYLKLNTGVLLLRVHNWSLALLNRMIARGGRTRQARRRHAVEIQRYVKNLCVGCIDDQATLLELLHREPSVWRTHAVLERRFPLQGHWEDYAAAVPETAFAAAAAHAKLVAGAASGGGDRGGDGGGGGDRGGGAPPLRQLSAPAIRPLTQRVHGSARVPLSIHFAGCQLCSGKAPEISERCWPVFRRTIRFAEDQALLPLGVRHARANRSAAESLPLEPA